MQQSTTLPIVWKRVVVLLALSILMLAAQPLCTRPACADAAPAASQTL